MRVSLLPIESNDIAWKLMINLNDNLNRDIEIYRAN